jgi:hypothetical protein
MITAAAPGVAVRLDLVGASSRHFGRILAFHMAVHDGIRSGAEVRQMDVKFTSSQCIIWPMSDNPDVEADDPSLPTSGHDGEVATVARGILMAYFNKLADTEGFADIAARLCKAVLHDNQFSDAAIKAALFPDVT